MPLLLVARLDSVSAHSQRVRLETGAADALVVAVTSTRRRGELGAYDRVCVEGAADTLRKECPRPPGVNAEYVVDAAETVVPPPPATPLTCWGFTRAVLERLSAAFDKLDFGV